MTTLALAAFGVLARRAIARAFEMHITFAARAAFAEQKLLAIAGEISEELDPGVFLCGTTWLFANFTAIDRIFEARNRIIWLLVFNPPSAIYVPQLVNHRSNRNLYDFVRRIFAMHFFAAPVSTAFRLDNRLVEKMSEVVRVLISLQDNIAAASAVTPVRSPLRNEFFAPETDTPPSALSGLRKNFDAIEKHDERHCHSAPALSSAPRPPNPKSSGFQAAIYNKGGLETAASCTSVRGSAERRPTKDHRDRGSAGRDSVEPGGEGQIGPQATFPQRWGISRLSNLVAVYPVNPVYR